ncbi:hypothetical protein PtA15_5A869 [Puccinia triticina]|uniref:Fatty acid synthase subunit alpha acyl carrier domain-containing protein n=1 Tax=Puccinia triticina TaxID=208348 RepID=A0ABY7CJK0_9BASI|nr:uncharacterized protein PtA15_5A869 [Puccinia triticina]WAQ85294.1 hypothetical protein PtA15_5A869 [Puccinia triticina]
MSREILCISKNIKEIYGSYQYKDKVEGEASSPAANEPAAASPAAVAVAAPAPVAASSGPVVAAIKDFVGGKSTLQNELLGSAQAEFGSAPDKAEEGKLSVQLPCTEMTTVTLKGKIAYEEVNRVGGYTKKLDRAAVDSPSFLSIKDPSKMLKVRLDLALFNGLAMDLDYILPFAAIPENGREINGLDDRSELAHRVMLTNLLRLMGEVKKKKHALKLVTRPTQMVLPLSPNHGNFGNDGLYSESNLARHIVQSMVF